MYREHCTNLHNAPQYTTTPQIAAIAIGLRITSIVLHPICRFSSMSANYWSSSQRTVWQHTRQSLADCRRRLLVLEKKMIQNGFIKDYPHITYLSHVRIYLHNCMYFHGPVLGTVSGCPRY
jgi:hypothetical protein